MSPLFSHLSEDFSERRPLPAVSYRSFVLESTYRALQYVLFFSRRRIVIVFGFRLKYTQQTLLRVNLSSANRSRTLQHSMSSEGRKIVVRPR
ncbi:hypothetical protein EVAR_3185_1 [Eumeta japonica]|uniref:Uncharacterized protein n=1 Tax=Eumeta variegata TaxID=151549 RepID=A0A4C1XH37_EUMVA|nr:hypothetical protein EVAR_3185_1 [Eumeta japonica]